MPDSPDIATSDMSTGRRPGVNHSDRACWQMHAAWAPLQSSCSTSFSTRLTQPAQAAPPPQAEQPLELHSRTQIRLAFHGPPGTQHIKRYHVELCERSVMYIQIDSNQSRAYGCWGEPWLQALLKPVQPILCKACGSAHAASGDQCIKSLSWPSDSIIVSF